MNSLRLLFSRKEETPPLLLQKFAFWRMIFWAINAVIVILIFTLAQGVWKQVSVLYLVLVSLYANFATDWTNWQAARTEVREERIEGESK